MMRIGDFSKLSRVTVKTLRYYDEVGLLKAAHVDDFTGYRYYTYDQLPRLNRILALKDLGFSLEEIRQMLDDGLSAEEMRGMLRLRQAEIRQQVEEETERLNRVAARLKLINQEDVMKDYEVVIKPVAAMKVAALRDVVPMPPDQGRLWGELEAHLAKQGVRPAGPCLTLYYDEDYKERDWDVEVCEPVTAELEETQRIRVRTLPGHEQMACVVHHGPFTTISEAYDALMKWISENGYRITGAAREVYLREAAGGNQNDTQTVTEIQFPVAKAD